MPVIGRLDGQVEAMLIEPLKRRHEPGVDEAAAANAQVASETEPKHAAIWERACAAKTDEQRDADVALPVWLL
jgi:hypothetical protein